MRASVAAADTARMSQRRIVVFMGASILVFGVIGGVVFYGSTKPSRIDRTVACIHGLGYSAYSYHDDGVERVTDPDIALLAGDSMQVRPASDHVIIKVRSGGVAEMTVPEDGGQSEIVDHGDPLNAGERAALAGCAA